MTILLQGAGLQTTVITPPDPIGDALRSAALAYWKFDESSGARADATGRGNNAAETNGSTSAVAGRVGSAAHFTGVSGRCLKCAHSDDLILDITKNFYVAGWVRFTSKAADQYILFSEDTVGFNIEYYLTYLSSSDLLSWDANGQELTAATFGSVPTGTWLFIEIFFRVSDANIGIAVNNGAFNETPTAPQTLYNNDTTLFLGDLDYGEQPLFGDLDEWYYSHTIPDQTGRDYLWNSGAGRALFPAP